MSADASSDAPAEGGRRRLVLKPRSEDAARKAEEERRATTKASPFGDAKPRESIIAARTGKTEEEVLKAAVLAEGPLKLRLSPEQVELKKAAEARIRDAEAQADTAEDDAARSAASGALAVSQSDLAALLVSFEKAQLDAAHKGGYTSVSEQRAHQAAQEAAMEEQGGGNGGGGGGPRGGGGGGRDSYNDRGGGRDGGGGGSGSFDNPAPRGGQGFDRGGGGGGRGGGGGGGGFGGAYEHQPSGGGGGRGGNAQDGQDRY